MAKRTRKPPAPPAESEPAFTPLAFPEPEPAEPVRKRRKTLAEMAAAGNESLGIVCDTCGGTDWQVYYTRSGVNRIKRVRICKKCLTRVQTYEKKVWGE